MDSEFSHKAGPRQLVLSPNTHGPTSDIGSTEKCEYVTIFGISGLSPRYATSRALRYLIVDVTDLQGDVSHRWP